MNPTSYSKAVLYLFAFSILFLYGTNIQAQTIAQRLDSLFTAPGNFESLNGGVLVAEKGKIIYQRSFGFADLEKKKPNTGSASFEIASNTKTFTSTAILQLKEKGRLRLEDPFVKWFPDFPYPAITIRHLLTHTSGLMNDGRLYFYRLRKEPGHMLTNADAIPSIRQFDTVLNFQPGDNFEYCNINYELLALLIEKISGLSYSDYLRKYIFIPAGMTHTRLQMERPEVPDTNLVNNYMTPPGKMFLATLTNIDSIQTPGIKQRIQNFKELVGDGGIISTFADMLRYSEALYAGKLLKPSTLEEAYTANRLNNGKDYEVYGSTRPGTAKLGNIHYGLGWDIHGDTSMGRIVSHGGHYMGIWSGFIRNISKDQTIITYDNTDWSGADLLNRMALDILNNKPIENLLSKRSLARVYGQCLLQKGPDAAFSKLMVLKGDTVHYILDGLEVNTLGYQFLGAGYTAQALETFKINTLLSPNSANTYDSYGDALVQSGDKEAAIAMYKKALGMNPKNEEEKQKLQKLLTSPIQK
jgi:CubicO group peptidase (beta-lactamase class C family)